MPPIPVFLPYYLGIPLFGGLAALVFARMRRARREGAAATHPRTAAVLLVTLVALTGLSAALTVQEAVLASTWVYRYSLSVETNTSLTGSIVLPVAADRALLANFHTTEGSAHWSFVNTSYGPGLEVDFAGPCALEAADLTFAPLGSHPDPGLAPQTGGGGQDGWQVWIGYQGTGSVDVNFQYGSGYVVNGAAVYIGPLKPGWNLYSLLSAP